MFGLPDVPKSEIQKQTFLFGEFLPAGSKTCKPLIRQSFWHLPHFTCDLHPLKTASTQALHHMSLPYKLLPIVFHPALSNFA
jgi:hypothetical protein